VTSITAHRRPSRDGIFQPFQDTPNPISPRHNRETRDQNASTSYLDY
ncbi:unnamed protein product, partial [marine sediment metagenome]